MQFNRLARRGAALCLPFCLSIAHAGRPLVTDDAAVLDPGTCQLEAWTARGPGQAWVAPACNVGADWEVGVGAGHVQGVGPAAYIQAKTVFRPLTEQSWGAGMTLARSSSARHGGPRDSAVNLLFSVPLATSLVMHANSGFVRHSTDGHGARTWAAALEMSRGRLGMSFERFGENRNCAGWQAGARWSAIPGALDVDAGFGRQRSAGVTTSFATAGLTWTFGR